MNSIDITLSEWFFDHSKKITESDIYKRELTLLTGLANFKV